MLTVHHLGYSQSERVVWLCEELGIPYALDKHDRDPVTRMAPPAYKALHPFGTAPVITDGEVVLGETGAILDYIVARHGNGRLTVASAAANFPDYLFWLHFANASLMPAAMVDMLMARLPADDAARMEALRRRIDVGFDLVEARLGAVPYFAGADFSLADIMMVFPLTTMRHFSPRDYAAFPAIRAYLARIGARPAYRAAMAKGDPDMPLLLD